MASSLTKKIAKNAHREEHWIPLSDLMTGLMMMFMLIAVLFMLKVQKDSEKLENMKIVAEKQAERMKSAAELYSRIKEQLYADLYDAFKAKLPVWHAELDHDLTIRFEEPSILFDDGKSELKEKFKEILADFFPRYVGILSSKKYRDAIEEIRIEGHTSVIWNAQTPPDVAYFKNMELSQSRTRTTLEYVIRLPKIALQRRWLIAKTTANGLSSSRPRFNPDGSENQKASQRVEFRVRTNAEMRIGEILKAGQQ